MGCPSPSGGWGHKEGLSCEAVTRSVGAEKDLPCTGHLAAVQPGVPPPASSPPGPSEMPLVLALCPLPSSHQLVTASSLGWQGSSGPRASCCLQRPALPSSFPRPGEAQRPRQPERPGPGPALPPGSCRCARSGAPRSLRRCAGWEPSGKGWAGSRAVLPAGCGPGLAGPLRLLAPKADKSGGGRVCVPRSGAGCSAPFCRVLPAQTTILRCSGGIWLSLGSPWPRGVSAAEVVSP